jgi:hypothetical protein
MSSIDLTLQGENSRKLIVLSQIAARFNEAHILWALGGSALLYLKKKTTTFHDLDLLVSLKDASKAVTILKTISSIEAPHPNPKYPTQTFVEFQKDGVEIDLMAGFAIRKEGIVYDCSLTPEQIVESMPLYGTDIPLQSLALWRRYYQLMDRPLKVGMIDSDID